ncbi:hypothetical protein H477_1396 [[Clostridium] sordellii ATCC 9714]|nr:hypothetical protein H477_1396 [[Clostridium] sordellii ATCC 9714] [Paeniclostridium sordellii ATCC 9714]
MGDRYKIDKLKENYNNIKIPARLNDVVNDAINKKVIIRYKQNG